MFWFRCENNRVLKLDSPLYAHRKADGNCLSRDGSPKAATGAFLFLLNFQVLGKCLTSVINKNIALGFIFEEGMGVEVA